MRNPVKFALAAGLLSLTLACAKAPAQAALTAGQTALDAARPEAEQYAPDALKGVNDALKGAQEKFNTGDYAGALAAAKEIPGKVDALKKQVAEKKDALTKEWTALSAEMPKSLEGVSAKLTELTALNPKKLPAGLDAAKLTAAGGDLAKAKGLFEDATAAGAKGDFTAALAKAGEAKGLLGNLMTLLGMAPEAPVAAASAPASAPAASAPASAAKA